jgi:ABC-type transport system involved in multi-copper enzyme maturation permease subunit
MNVFSELFNDLTGWLTVGIIVFMLVMMVFCSACLLINHLVAKSKNVIYWFVNDIRNYTS